MLGSPSSGKNSNGRYSPSIQNMLSFGSSINDDATSAEFSCINNDRYRNFVTGLHLQSLTQRQHFHQNKPTDHHIHHSKQQSASLRNSFNSQHHDVRSLRQTHDYQMYQQHDEQHQKLLNNTGQDIFAVNAILNNTEKYFGHNMECYNGSNDAYKQEQRNPNVTNRLSQHPHTHHSHRSRAEHMTEEISNRIYLPCLSGHEIDVKYTPPHKNIFNFDTNFVTRCDLNLNKRPADANCINKSTTEEGEDDSGIVDCDHEDVQRKRKKSQMITFDCGNVEIKAEVDEMEFRNKEMPPLRTKSY